MSAERTRVRNTSVATRLALAVLTVSITSVVVTVAVGIVGVQGSADDAQTGRLESVRSAKAAEIESYFRFQSGQVAQMAASETFIEGVQAFAAAYDELDAETTPEETNAPSDRLRTFYLDQFLPALEEVRGEGIPPRVLVPQSAAAIALQDAYIASNPGDAERRALLTDAEDGSIWTEVHTELHPSIRATVGRLELVDLYLVEPNGDTIVYSTAKEPDFATSLDSGPYRGTELAALVDRVKREPEPGDVQIADFTAFAPSLDAPASFMASPLFDGEQLVGILVVEIDAAEINRIMSRDWRTDTLGDSGEIYLVGVDRRMRSDSRAFVEDRDDYLRRIDAVGEIGPSDRAAIVSHETTILFQPIDSEAVDAVFDIDDGLISLDSYLGEEVFSAYEPLNLPGLDWAIVAEIDREEILEPVDDYRVRALIIAGVFVAALTFLAVLWATAFVSPVRAISAAVKRARRGELDIEIRPHGPREFRELAEGVNTMFVDLEANDAALAAATAEKRSLLHRLLPGAVAQAVASGDRTLLETVPQATVVVLALDGLGSLVANTSVDTSREVLHDVIDELDALADAHGLERVAVLGDTYTAGCGLSTAHLDHAPRSVAFALQASDAVQGVAGLAGFRLKVGAGIDSGSVTIGLTGESRLVYDLWGETVSSAHRLARVAAPGEILVSAATQARLPEHQRTRATGHNVAGHEAWAVDTSDSPQPDPVR